MNPSPARPPTLRVTDVTHTYRTTPALAVDHLEFEPGATAVLGPNGSGKSTLLRLLATVVDAQTGTLRVDDLDPHDHVARTAIRRRLGYVAQRDGLPPRMRVREYCDYVGALKEIGPARLRRRWTGWVLDRVALADMADLRIGALSGGMQRRLSIAQSLLGRPDLLVLDEPLAALDAEHRASMTAMIAERAADSTVVVATHHADELATICDRVVVIDDGATRFAGPPAALAERARGRVWETDRIDPRGTCRAVGPGRFRCVGPAVPAGTSLVEPTVADGYLITVRTVT